METEDMREVVSVVVAASGAIGCSLGALFSSWGWHVAAVVGDDLAGVTAVRQTRPDLLVVHGAAFGAFGDLDLLAHAVPSCRTVMIADLPQRLGAFDDSVLSGLPSEALRARLYEVASRPSGEAVCA